MLTDAIINLLINWPGVIINTSLTYLKMAPTWLPIFRILPNTASTCAKRFLTDITKVTNKSI